MSSNPKSYSEATYNSITALVEPLPAQIG